MKPFEPVVAESEVRVPLVADLDLFAAESLRDALCEAIDHGKRLVLDGSRVERLSTACIQVLLSAARTIERDGREMRLEDPSPALISAFADLGLSSEIVHWSADE